MEHKETGCQAPKGPILCTNNCGFFGSAASMNMCSKCHKDMILKQEQAKQAASSIDSIVNGSSNGKELIILDNADVAVALVEQNRVPAQTADIVGSSEGNLENAKVKDDPSRCNTCRKRVGLTGFNCRCGNIFCATHRYSDRHQCPFDYQTAARDAIARSNPVVKAEKLDRL